MSGPTDLVLLRSLLDAGRPKLTSNEDTAFCRMLADLETGSIVNLSKKQREWAEKKYFELKLDQAYKNRAPAKVAVLKAPAPKVFPWEQNRPLKPPGK